MRIVIVGGGVVGQNLAEELAHEDHDLTVIDRDPAVVQVLSDRLDVFALAGDGGSPRVLEEAGVRDAEMVVAVTDSDHLNMFICLLAETMGVKNKLARVRNDEYAQPRSLELIRRKLAIDRIINPEALVVEHVAKIIAAPGATDAHELADGQILVHSFNIHAGVPLAGKRLKEVRPLLPDETFLIVSLSRNGQMIIPGGDDEILVGDHITVVMGRGALPRFLPLVERRRLALERAFVFDAGRLGLAVTRMIERSVPNVVVFEPDTARANVAALTLEWSLVVKGSATDLDLLQEYDLRTCDLFVAASDDEEENLLAALLARRHGARKTIVVTSRHANVPLLASTGIDVVIEPKILTVSEILSHVRGGRVLSVAKVEGDAEAIELLATRHAPLVGKPLREVDIPRGVLIGAIIRREAGGRVEVPTGDSVVQPLDKVIVFTLPEGRAQAEALVSAGAGP
ncbi:MAG: Trk system potassium transporter TrkA [Planctomycetes bacterium]|nr:Trk system potassium transporter TrkA [Planctomycetota bacterium]